MVSHLIPRGALPAHPLVVSAVKVSNIEPDKQHGCTLYFKSKALLTIALPCLLLNAALATPEAIGRAITRFSRLRMDQAVVALAEGIGNTFRNLFAIMMVVVVLVASIFAPRSIKCLKQKPLPATLEEQTKNIKVRERELVISRGKIISDARTDGRAQATRELKVKHEEELKAAIQQTTRQLNENHQRDLIAEAAKAKADAEVALKAALGKQHKETTDRLETQLKQVQSNLATERTQAARDIEQAGAKAQAKYNEMLATTEAAHRAALDMLHSNNQKDKEELEKAQKELSQNSKKTEELQRSQDSTITALQTKITKLETEYDSKKKEAGEAEEAARIALEEQTKQVTALQQQIQQLETELTEARTKSNAEESSTSAVTASTSEQDERVSKLQHELNEARQQLQAFQDELNEAREESQHARVSALQLKIQFEATLKQKIDDIRQQSTLEYAKMARELETRLKTKDQELVNFTQKSQSLIVKINSENEKLKQELASTKSKLQAADAKIQGYTDAFHTANATIKQHISGPSSNSKNKKKKVNNDDKGFPSTPVSQRTRSPSPIPLHTEARALERQKTLSNKGNENKTSTSTPSTSNKGQSSRIETRIKTPAKKKKPNQSSLPKSTNQNDIPSSNIDFTSTATPKGGRLSTIMSPGNSTTSSPGNGAISSPSHETF